MPRVARRKANMSTRRLRTWSHGTYILSIEAVAWISAPTILELSLGEIPKTSIVPAGDAAELCAAKAYDWT
eukprot:9260081-Pyramimonas_sp.AAC.1